MANLPEIPAVLCGQVMGVEKKFRYVDNKRTDEVSAMGVTVVSSVDGRMAATKVTVRMEDVPVAHIVEGGTVAWLISFGAYNDGVTARFVRAAHPENDPQAVFEATRRMLNLPSPK